MNDKDQSFYYSKIMGVVAPALGWTPPIRYLLRRSRILSLLKNSVRSLNILEVGCGAGALLCEISQLGHSAQGLETSEKAMELGNRLAQAAESPHRVISEPQPDWIGKFDCVCAFDVLEHIEDDGAALRQWMSWLAPGGNLIISVPAHRSRFGAGDIWAGHWRRYDRSELQNLMSAHSLCITHFECYGFPLANATEALGNRTYRKMLKQRSGNSKADATASSGIDRQNYLRINKWIDTIPGRAIISGSILLQNLTRNLDWGSGYLLVATKK